MVKLNKIVLALLFLSFNLFAQFGQQDLVKIKSQKDNFEIQSGKNFDVVLKISIEDEWHINSNKPKEDFLIPSKIDLSKDAVLKGFKLNSVKFPKAKDLQFDFSETPVSVFEGEFEITANISAPGNIDFTGYDLEIIFGYQACNNSTCLAPNSASTKIPLTNLNSNNAKIDGTLTEETIKSKTEIQDEKVESENEIAKENKNLQENNEASQPLITFENNNSDVEKSQFESKGLFLSLLIAFLGGLALNLTPCVYPLIPITVSYFGGQSEGSTNKLLVLGILYVLGMAVTYSTIGVITALSGAVFGALMQNPIVILVIVGVLVALSLSMFGLYEFRLPNSLVMKAGGAKGGYLGAVFMGLTMGIVAAPCIGPFVLGMVTYVGAKGDPYYGFAMFFSLAIGLGIPYIVLATFSGKIKSLPRAGFWMESVKHIFGFVLIGMALYFLTPLLPKSISGYVLPVFMILAGLYLTFFDKASNNLKGFRIFKIVFSAVMILVGAYFLIPQEKSSPEWVHFSDDVYTSAIQTNKPMILDFYADWCIPCKELDALTFSNDKVIEESKRFANLKIDMTKSMDNETELLRKRFNIIGMPTVLIINSKGEEVKRITGFVNADEFYSIVSSVN